MRIQDPNSQQRQNSVAYFKESIAIYTHQTCQPPGDVKSVESLEEALTGAWLVIEAIPEILQLKIDTFAYLETFGPTDCILASNSSSYKSSELVERVSDATRSRILNMQYYMPPRDMVVELMTDGHTEEAIFPFMVERCKEGQTFPYVARKESTGFIFNRLWAAIKRETLTILAEDVSTPQEIDSLWYHMFLKEGAVPCRAMDGEIFEFPAGVHITLTNIWNLDVGLDTVALIESHYVKELDLCPEKTVDFLNARYIKDGKLGTKSQHGGLYPPSSAEEPPAQAQSILVLDLGLSSVSPTMSSGSILEYSITGQIRRTLVVNQALPDGLAVDTSGGLVFWTNMGIPGKQDGTVLSLNLDTAEVKPIVAPGAINTPKQLTLDKHAKKLYFCDREGCRVYRCNFDGSELETVVSTSDALNVDPEKRVHDWCVGIAVDSQLGKFYWSQKGPSKGGQGRIFCANISTPVGTSGVSRTDVECILDNLPEPIDLEISEFSKSLYWTDCGEIPFGNSVNRAQLDASGRIIPNSSTKKYEVLYRHFNEAIGLKVDEKSDSIYVTDLGGRIYRCDLNGKHKAVLVNDENRAFAGVSLI